MATGRIFALQGMAARACALRKTTQKMRILLLWTLLALPALAKAQYVAGDSAQPQAPPAYGARPAQAAPNPSLWDRTRLGGNFGFSFGRVTYLEASPLLIYMVNERLQVGPGLTYIYLRSNVPNFTYSTSIFGGRLFGRYFVLPDAFLQTELEVLNLSVRNADFNGRYTITNPLVGGGYRIPLGRSGSGLFFTALYNLNHITNLTPYPSPLIVRVGVAF